MLQKIYGAPITCLAYASKQKSLYSLHYSGWRLDHRQQG